MPTGRHESESRELPAAESPYDAEGRVSVPGAPEWRYLSIRGAADHALVVELQGPDDAQVTFIRAWERTERAAGVGG